MNLAVFCVVLLVSLHGNAFGEISFEGKIVTSKEDGKIFPKPGKPAVSNTSHSGRMINGKEGSIEEYPYIVYMIAEGWMCGATIITYWHAFTAAHCVKNSDPATIKLYGGSTSRITGGIEFSVSKAIVHPKYAVGKGYDAAIIEVSNTFAGYKNIEPIAIQDVEVPAGTSCYAAGWGYTDDESIPENLQYIMLRALSSEECLKPYYGYNAIICGQSDNGGSICGGDSGGPLVCDGKLTGAASFSSPTCSSDSPSAFAYVMSPAIRKFIRKHAGI